MSNFESLYSQENHTDIAENRDVGNDIENIFRKDDADDENGDLKFQDIGPCPLQQKVEIITKIYETESSSPDVPETGLFQWTLRIAGLIFVILGEVFRKNDISMFNQI